MRRCARSDRDGRGNIGRRVVRYATGMSGRGLGVKRARKSVVSRELEIATRTRRRGSTVVCDDAGGEEKKKKKYTHRYTSDERTRGCVPRRGSSSFPTPLARSFRAASDAVASATTPHSTRRCDVVDGVSSHRRRACGANEFFPSHRAITGVGDRGAAGARGDVGGEDDDDGWAFGTGRA